MEEIDELIRHIKSLPNCRISPPIGFPRIDNKHELPPDVRRFYELCGGVLLYENKAYTCHIVSPEEFKLSNPIIIGEIWACAQ
jgi:hypothetical protein